MGRITNTIASSGRFWPVGLAMIIAAITILYRNLDRRWFLSVLTVAIVVQVVDLQPLFRLAHGNAESYRTLVAPDSDITSDLMRSRDVILVFPGALCGVIDDRDRALQIQLLAARAGRPSMAPISTAAIARAARLPSSSRRSFRGSRRLAPCSC